MIVTVYTTPTCGFCQQVKAYLSRRGVPFVERDVSRDPQAAMEMMRISGQQGVPVVVIDGQVVVGANIPLIERLLVQHTARPRLGISIADATRIAAERGIQLPRGAYIGKVHPGSAAEAAGLRPGDVIVQLAGQPINDDRDLHRIVEKLRSGTIVDALFWRGGQTHNTQIHL